VQLLEKMALKQFVSGLQKHVSLIITVTLANVDCFLNWVGYSCCCWCWTSVSDWRCICNL